MRVAVGLLCLLAPLSAFAEIVVPPPPQPEQTLRTFLAQTYAAQMPGHTINITHEELGCVSIYRGAISPPLYPGTGVATVLVAQHTTIGLHGTVGDLAPVAAACNWLRTPPSPELFTRLLSASHFEGMLATRTPTTVTVSNGTLRAVVHRADPMRGNELETIEYEYAGRSPSVLRRIPVQTAAAPTPSPRTILQQAASGQSVSALDLQTAIRAVRGTTDGTVLDWLATISTLPTASDTIPASVIDQMGGTPETAVRLRNAWRNLPAPRRTALLSMAQEFYGAAFRQLIERP